MCRTSAFAGIWISTYGRICNTRHRISTGYCHGHNYRATKIDGKNYLVHRLVAFTHLPPPPTPEHDRVLHVDGDPSNNHVSNLMYATSKECGEVAGKATIGLPRANACKAVLSRAPGGRTWVAHRSVTAAAQAWDMSRTTVSRLCAGERAARSGVVFKYVEHEDLLGERWKHAVHPLTYSTLHDAWVSSKGRVRTTTGTVTWGSLQRDGYRKVCIDGTTHAVHRLVLCSFAESLPNIVWVANHIDGNRQNNSLDNLEFATQAQNVEHSYRPNLRKSPLPSCPVLGRPLRSQEWIRFESQTAAAMHLCCSQGSISHVCRGRLKSVCGWEFQFDCFLDDPAFPGEQWAPVVLKPSAA